MKGKRYTEEQIIAVLKEGQSGVKADHASFSGVISRSQ